MKKSALCMERMRIRVEEIDRDHDAHTTVGRVTAVSRRKLRGRPVAVLELLIRVPVLERESLRATRRRVRDEALLFVDPA